MSTTRLSTSALISSSLKNSRGFTLIEMVIAIVVLAAGVSGILFSFTQNIGASADPMIQQQAIIIAQGYLEEAVLKPYSDPDGESGTCEEGALNRIQFDDVNDYNCITNSAPEDQFGNGITELNNYIVDVSVGPASIGTASVPAWKIDVTVSHDSGINIVLTGYRTSYY